MTAPIPWFPKRDTRSDGSIGDTSHQGYPSSHNPDRTGRAEYRDGDQLDGVRARDFDADLHGSRWSRSYSCG